GAVLPHGQQRRPRFTLAVLPTRKTLALADKGFRAGRQRFGIWLLENAPHASPTLSLRLPLRRCGWLFHRRAGRLSGPASPSLALRCWRLSECCAFHAKSCTQC